MSCTTIGLEYSSSVLALGAPHNGGMGPLESPRNMSRPPSPLPARVTAQSVDRYLAAARGGRQSALEKLFDYYRAYLTAIARRSLDQRLQPKCAPSDLVQETLTLAFRKFAAQNIIVEAELRTWLRKLLKNKIRATQRRYGRGTKRDIAKEVSLYEFESKQMLFELAAQAGESLGADLDRPESVKRIEAALARLSEGHRLIIELHHRQNRKFTEIAQRLNRSPDAIRMLWVRALRRLAKELERGNNDV